MRFGEWLPLKSSDLPYGLTLIENTLVFCYSFWTLSSWLFLVDSYLEPIDSFPDQQLLLRTDA